MGGCQWAAGIVACVLAFGIARAEAQPAAPPSEAPDADRTEAPAAPEPVAPAPTAPVVPAPTAPAAPAPAAPAPAAPAPVAPAAVAKAPPPFGARGQITVLGGSDIGVSSSSYDGSAAKYDYYNFSPEVDYFVARNVSLGLAVGLSYSDQRGYGADGSLVETQTKNVQVGPRVSVNIPLGRSFSFFPGLTVGYEWIETSESLVSGQSLSIVGYGVGFPLTHQSGPYISVYAPILFHPVSHFILGFGPEFFHEFGGVTTPANIGAQATTVGAGFIAGIHWGGDETGGAAPSPPDPSERLRFGDSGEVVLSNDLDAFIHSVSRSGTPASTLNGGVGGSVDYFAAPHVSIGGALSLTGSSGNGFDGSTGAPVQYNDTQWMVWLRLGVGLPILPWLSFYPVGEIGFGGQTYNETENGAQNQSSGALVAVSLYAPLLVHPAPHAFIGFGPGIYQDLSAQYTDPALPNSPSIQNRETTLSLSLVVGGWI